MSPTLNGSSVLQRFICSNTVKNFDSFKYKMEYCQMCYCQWVESGHCFGVLLTFNLF